MLKYINFMSKKEYRVSNFEEGEVSPEETLADHFSQYSKVESPMGYAVMRVFHVFIGLVLVFFTFSSFRLQILRGEDFRKLALANRSAVYEIPSMRGNILDSSGKVLAGSKPVFDLVAISADLPKETEALEKITNGVAKIIGEPAEGLKEIFNDRHLQAVFFIKKDISKEQVLQIQNLYQRGVYVVNGVQRWYPDGTKFSSVLGYTGKVDASDLTDPYYTVNDRKGRVGLEENYENYLRGEHGRIFFDRASKKYVVSSPEPGDSVVLNIDSQIQEHLYDAMSQVLRSVGLQFGSAVVQNPQNGEILGMVSFPSFDGNQLAGELSEATYQKYFLSKEKPTFNRSVSGRYNPGSTIKLLLALAGLKEGVITPDTTITDLSGYITIPNIYNPEIVYKYRDWKVQGTVNLKKAIAQSSDIYFYSVGGGSPAGGGSIKGLGFAKLEKYFRDFLIDKTLGIDLKSENSGFVPSEEWKLEKFGQPWFTGDTYNVSIGQGDLTVTPLWLSSYVSAIANGGTIYRPFLAKKIVDSGQNTIKKSFSSEKLAKLPFDDNTLNIVREGMREVVLSGTAQSLNLLPAPVAAKTGTAEVGIKGSGLNSIFIAYAPYDDPKIALSVVVEKIGHNQGLAIAVAKNFLKWYLTR